ncbi:post-GPI attachment to proteins factor 6 [Hyperolius riggenbachi]|uniref:post-GPI attachment to proteins factor 6 n=1 Tax=Hyperolius riggenbachi TaxID=752182 RepID=UPI0035A305E1
MEPPILLLLLLLCLTSCWPASTSQDLSYVSEIYAQGPQRLSFYNWYGNARLYQFRVPVDAVLLRWFLQANRGKGSKCENAEITVHFRYGAPPVINPLGFTFAGNTSVPNSFSQTMTFRNSMLQSNIYLNVTNPTPGDWFIAAHLPRDTEKIEIQGLTKSCTYIFQPELFVLREVDVPILQADTPTQQVLDSMKTSARFKIYVPEYTRELQLQVLNCSPITSQNTCPLILTIGSASQIDSSPRQVNCSESGQNCSLLLLSPPWEKWLNVVLETPPSLNGSASFQIVHTISVCKPGVIGSRSILSFLNLLPSNSTLLQEGQLSNTTILPNGGGANSCLRKYPVIREYLDVVSVRFHPINGPSIPVVAQLPSVVMLSLDSEMDSGGMLVVNLQLNRSASSSPNTTVMACLSAAAPLLSLNTTQNCTTAFFQGYSYQLNAAAYGGTHNIPYPETDRWYLSMQLLCSENDSVCQQQTARVIVSAYLSPCLDDCGPYGECRLLRRNGYLYAACSCKAGWAGWSCTDGRNALSVAQQLTATLLLTLSNLIFVPTIAVAVYNLYFVEAAVYAYTMFFSTFYHACDQPGVTVMCIMDYDTLQFCDFFGSVVAIWVTILCMARLKKPLKYVLFILGSLVIAMSMQLDRRGIWNMLGPCLFALIIMVIAWTIRGVRRRHCYPPSWKRWVFFLLPGVALALTAISVYVFAETNANYYYTHSLWHIMVASSVAFLLPPREKNTKAWQWSQLLDCHYKICKEDREELYVVT